MLRKGHIGILHQWDSPAGVTVSARRHICPIQRTPENCTLGPKRPVRGVRMRSMGELTNMCHSRGGGSPPLEKLHMVISKPETPRVRFAWGPPRECG